MRQVSRTTLVALKNVQIPTVSKFDVVARFRETIPTVKSVSSFDRNYHFALFQKIRFSRSFTECSRAVCKWIVGEASSKFKHADPVKFGELVASFELNYEKGVGLPCTN